jgi:glycogen debranching enzyme
VFSKVRAVSILETAEKELVTQLGLRTLAKSDPAYVASYQGNMEERDKAYHNGTIWPFLLGFYLKAKYSYLGKEVKSEIHKRLTEFWSEIKNKELLYLPEIFDPTELTPDGALSQAWNYALFLEVINDIEL